MKEEFAAFAPDLSAPAYMRIPQAAICLAIQDAFSRNDDQARDARTWIFRKDGNFTDMALLAGWDAEWLRSQIRRLIDIGELPRRVKRTISGERVDELDDDLQSNATPPRRALPSRTIQASAHL